MSSKKRKASKVFTASWQASPAPDRGTGMTGRISDGGFRLYKGKRQPITRLKQRGLIWE